MKIQGAKKVHYDSGPNMTPLVDVLMVILIFLMLAGSFGGVTQFLVSKQGIKAKGGQGRPLKPGEVPDTPIDIYVDNAATDGSIFKAQGTGIPATTSPEALKQELAAKRELFLRNGTAPDKLQVVIHPKLNVRYWHLMQVYQSALQAKYEKVAFATAQ
jgi:biopolymer transport protein ExbD